MVSAKWLCFSVFALFLFSASAFGWFNDTTANDFGVTLESDLNSYHVGADGTLTVKIHAKNPGLPFNGNIGFYFQDKDSGETTIISALNSDGTGKNGTVLSPSASAMDFRDKPSFSKTGSYSVSIPTGESYFKVSFIVPAKNISGEFVITLVDSLNAGTYSVLDPWWDTGEITADSHTLGLWHFNEGAGVTAASDTNTPLWDLALTGASWDSVNQKFGASSFRPNALQYATNGVALDVTDPLGAITVSGWFRPDITMETGAGTNNLFYKRSDTGNDYYIYVYIRNADGQMVFQTGAAGHADKVLASGADFDVWTANTWYWFSVVWSNAAGKKIYVNGQLAATDAAETVLMGSDIDEDFYLGTNNGLANIFDGDFDEWEIANVDRNSTPPTPGAAARDDLNVLTIENKPAGAPLGLFSYAHDGNLTIDFNVFNSDNNRLFIDINYSTGITQGAGIPIVQDWNLTSAVCSSQNFNVLPIECSIDWNTMNVPDGNYYLLFDLNSGQFGANYVSEFEHTTYQAQVSQQIHLRFFDENHFNVPLVGQPVTIGSDSFVTNSDGNIDLNTSWMGASFGLTSITAGDDSNYGKRYFDLNYQGYGLNYSHLVLLKDVNGSNLNFKFYDEAGTNVLNGPIITVYRGYPGGVSDWNIAEVRMANSAGETSFFLHSDTNYVFRVQNGSSVLDYLMVAVQVQLPKNESSLATISPFDLTVSGIGLRTFLANGSAPTRYAFPNAITLYQFDVNAGLDYYNRKYFLNFKGNPKTYSLQPYLVARADSIQSVFVVRNSYSASGLPGIKIFSTKDIPTQGTVTVEQVETDSAGEAVLSFITNDTYYLYFYRDGEMVYNIELRPTATSYQVYLDLEKIVVPEPVWSVVDVNFMPRGGIIWIMPDGNIDLNQTIHVTGGTLSNTRVVVTNSGNKPAGTVLYDKNFDANSSTQFFQQEFDVDVNLSRLSPIKVTVYVTLSDGNVRTFSVAYSISGSTETGGQLFLALTTTMKDVFGSGGMMIISFLIILFVVGSTFGLGVDMGGSGILAVIVAAALAYLGWIPWLVWGAMALGATVLYVLTKRVEY